MTGSQNPNNPFAVDWLKNEYGKFTHVGAWSGTRWNIEVVVVGW